MPILGLVGSAYVLWAAVQDPESGQPSLIAGVGAMLVALAYYVLVVRRRGAWKINDPEDAA
jgi:hypothetical protein